MLDVFIRYYNDKDPDMCGGDPMCVEILDIIARKASKLCEQSKMILVQKSSCAVIVLLVSVIHSFFSGRLVDSVGRALNLRLVL